ncbi:molecular chaperone TorD family protein [Arabiibacter massiliensis]|uniref:molecular chaperone TorD family protein n=1 Tax=Arabiibacter massiliensis TaxID=1870985 RepID=UPI0009BC349C|nr:molecular chaperone TorD family protein [Arabiibacter massiliensis]
MAGVPNDTILIGLLACAPVFSTGFADDAPEADAAGMPEDARRLLAAHGLPVPDPVDSAARRVVEREVLTPGMPLAAMPVESLYKPWTSLPGSQFGGSRGLYLGDAARHVQSLYDALQVEVPERFAAMPDHLSLLCELLALYVEAGNDEAARRLAQDHFDWLDAYDAALAERAEQAASAPAYDEEGRAALARGIGQVRAHVALAAGLARLAGQGAPTPDGAQTAPSREERKEAK